MVGAPANNRPCAKRPNLQVRRKGKWPGKFDPGFCGLRLDRGAPSAREDFLNSLVPKASVSFVFIGEGGFAIA
jgi:hypothetical protein